MIGSQRIKRFLRNVRRRFVRGAVVLTYHRVADLARDPYDLSVSPDNFIQHLDYLKSTCSIMRLAELGEALENGDLPTRPVAITFDDGYADLLVHAHPILREANIPATVFVPGGLVGTEREFWWDELEHIFNSCDTVQKQLDLVVNGQPYHWDFGFPGDRDRARKNIHKLIKPLTHDERIPVLNELWQWTEAEQNCRPGYRPVNTEELTRLIDDGWIEIGAHTSTHAALSCLDENEQRREIVDGRDQLHEIINRAVPTFAYPYGEAEDFTGQTAAILRDEGFSMACTMIPGSLEPGTDMARLKRCVVYDWTPDEFARRLESYFIS